MEPGAGFEPAEKRVTAGSALTTAARRLRPLGHPGPVIVMFGWAIKFNSC